MYMRAVSIPDAVREIVSGNTVFMQSLQLGIANYTALAQKIKPDVEKITGSKVNANTIVVAIKRFTDALEVEIRPAATFKGARMLLTGNIIDVDFEKGFDEISDILNQLFDKNFSMFQTGQHLQLFAEDIAETRNVVNTATKKFGGKKREGLAMINIQLASGDQNPYEIVSLVSNILYNNQLSIQDAFFTPTEIVLILSDRDAARTYELLRTRMN
jgi:hypothetical protein